MSQIIRGCGLEIVEQNASSVRCVCSCVCVTCHILAPCIQSDTGRTATPLPHPGGTWGWSYCSCRGDVVEVVDRAGSVVPVPREGGGRGGRGEDTGEVRPSFVSSRTYKSAHTCVLTFTFQSSHTQRHSTSSHSEPHVWTLLTLKTLKPKWTEGGRAGDRTS